RQEHGEQDHAEPEPRGLDQVRPWHGGDEERADRRDDDTDQRGRPRERAEDDEGQQLPLRLWDPAEQQDRRPRDGHRRGRPHHPPERRQQAADDDHPGRLIRSRPAPAVPRRPCHAGPAARIRSRPEAVASSSQSRSDGAGVGTRAHGRSLSRTCNPRTPAMTDRRRAVPSMVLAVDGTDAPRTEEDEGPEWLPRMPGGWKERADGTPSPVAATRTTRTPPPGPASTRGPSSPSSALAVSPC